MKTKIDKKEKFSWAKARKNLSSKKKYTNNRKDSIELIFAKNKEK